ncbi:MULTISPECIES: hypothetical protein [unclassified Sphingopyxis]|uniref:hypothetical protein n=1 Tax=unclassified Sphingopyxis TaxID=2614943 RepID=UPI000A8A3FD8|nr:MULTISPECIES: hypothetical protein [unclassified Sphingopyxis]
MNKLLNALGLGPDDRIERLTNERNAALAERDVERERFKKAITDLAAAREEIAHLDECEKRLDADRNHWRAEANSLRPDAEAMRRKRERDRNRKAEKKEGGK